jgi:hypothetical protein
MAHGPRRESLQNNLLEFYVLLSNLEILFTMRLGIKMINQMHCDIKAFTNGILRNKPIQLDWMRNENPRGTTVICSAAVLAVLPVVSNYRIIRTVIMAKSRIFSQNMRTQSVIAVSYQRTSFICCILPIRKHLEA